MINNAKEYFDFRINGYTLMRAMSIEQAWSKKVGCRVLTGSHNSKNISVLLTIRQILNRSKYLDLNDILVPYSPGKGLADYIKPA